MRDIAWQSNIKGMNLTKQVGLLTGKLIKVCGLCSCTNRKPKWTSVFPVHAHSKVCHKSPGIWLNRVWNITCMFPSFMEEDGLLPTKPVTKLNDNPLHNGKLCSKHPEYFLSVKMGKCLIISKSLVIFYCFCVLTINNFLLRPTAFFKFMNLFENNCKCNLCFICACERSSFRDRN